MYIKDGIAYAGEQKAMMKVSGVRPLDNYRLWIRFNNGEERAFDFKPMLDSPAFSPLKDEAIFRAVYIDYGVTVWNKGAIDIAPEYLYEHSAPVGGIPDV